MPEVSCHHSLLLLISPPPSSLAPAVTQPGLTDTWDWGQRGEKVPARQSVFLGLKERMESLPHLYS